MNETLSTGPDFIIIGAMKAGTSTLYDQLARQPDIFMTTPKEPAYFADDTVFAHGPEWYNGLFADAPSGALRGEASTHYTKLPTYPRTLERMQTHPIHPKLIYVIRNPVQRALSHYLHELSQGVMVDDIRTSFAAHPELVSYGCYAQQLRPFIDTFGQDSVFLTSLEQIKADPQAEFSAIQTHIGASSPLVWNHGARPQNVSADRIRRLPFHRLLVESRLSKIMRRSLVPQGVRQKIRATLTIGTTRPQLPDDLRQDLEIRFTADSADLAQMFPAHPVLDLCYPFATP
jgi:hypothetical protein